MGGQPSKQEEVPLPTINHPKFHKAKFIKNNEVIRTTLSLDNYSDFVKWEQQLNQAAKFDDEILLLPKAYECNRQAVCGSAAILNLEFDNYSYILEEELKNRSSLRKHFNQEQIWYLVFSLSRATHDFLTVNSKVGDIRPSNIFIDETGHIKVSNMFSWPCEYNNFDKFIFDKEVTYIAPEEVEGTNEGKLQMFIDKYLAESFSIGLTALEASLLEPCAPLYNPKENTFNGHELTNKMKDWWSLVFIEVDEETNHQKQQKYSNELKVTIAALCELNPEERLTSEEVYEWLKPHQASIAELKRFNSGFPPVKNMQKYQPFMVQPTQYYQQPKTFVASQFQPQPQPIKSGVPPTQPVYINTKPVQVNFSNPVLNPNPPLNSPPPEANQFSQPYSQSKLIHIEKPFNPQVTSNLFPQQPMKIESQNKNYSGSGNYEFFKNTAEINSYHPPQQVGIVNFNQASTLNEKQPYVNENWSKGKNEWTGWTGWRAEGNEKKEQNNKSDDILKRIDAVLAQSRNHNF